MVCVIPRPLVNRCQNMSDPKRMALPHTVRFLGKLGQFWCQSGMSHFWCFSFQSRFSCPHQSTDLKNMKSTWCNLEFNVSHFFAKSYSVLLIRCIEWGLRRPPSTQKFKWGLKSSRRLTLIFTQITPHFLHKCHQGYLSQKLRDPTVLRKYKRDYCQGYIDAESSDDERIFFFLINLLDINNLEHTYQTCWRFFPCFLLIFNT